LKDRRQQATLVRDDKPQNYRQSSTATSGRSKLGMFGSVEAELYYSSNSKAIILLHILESDSANNQNHSRHPPRLPLSTAQPEPSSFPIVVFVAIRIVPAIPIKHIVVQGLHRRFHLPSTSKLLFLKAKNERAKGRQSIDGQS
jgi:hypothetical protein